MCTHRSNKSNNLPIYALFQETQRDDPPFSVQESNTKYNYMYLKQILSHATDWMRSITAMRVIIRNCLREATVIGTLSVVSNNL